MPSIRRISRPTRLIAALLVLCCVLGFLAVWSAGDDKLPDPICRGKPLSKWIVELKSSVPGASAAAAEVIVELGTNAVPRLLREASLDRFGFGDVVIGLLNKQPLFHMTATSDHQARALRGFLALKEEGARAVAAGLADTNKWIRHGCVGQWEMCVAYPEILFEPMLRCLDDPEPQVRARAANALGVLHQKPEKAVPALMRLLDDPDDWVRCMAAAGLDMYGDDAKVAVPRLLSSLTNCSSEYRQFGVNAVRKLDPQAALNAGY